jgi:hypothetical protein
MELRECRDWWTTVQCRQYQLPPWRGFDATFSHNVPTNSLFHAAVRATFSNELSKMGVTLNLSQRPADQCADRRFNDPAGIAEESPMLRKSILLAVAASAALGLAMFNPGIASAKSGYSMYGGYGGGHHNFRVNNRGHHYNWQRHPYRPRPSWQRPSRWDWPIRGL